MAQHTPGPWRAGRNDGYSLGIYAEGEQTFDLATVHNGGNDGEAIANARLIAAAPELLAAIQDALAAMEVGADALCSDPNHDVGAAAALELSKRHARAAIAKAEGR